MANILRPSDFTPDFGGIAAVTDAALRTRTRNEEIAGLKRQFGTQDTGQALASRNAQATAIELISQTKDMSSANKNKFFAQFNPGLEKFGIRLHSTAEIDTVIETLQKDEQGQFISTFKGVGKDGFVKDVGKGAVREIEAAKIKARSDTNKTIIEARQFDAEFIREIASEKRKNANDAILALKEKAPEFDPNETTGWWNKSTEHKRVWNLLNDAHNMDTLAVSILSGQGQDIQIMTWGQVSAAAKKFGFDTPEAYMLSVQNQGIPTVASPTLNPTIKSMARKWGSIINPNTPEGQAAVREIQASIGLAVEDRIKKEADEIEEPKPPKEVTTTVSRKEVADPETRQDALTRLRQQASTQKDARDQFLPGDARGVKADKAHRKLMQEIRLVERLIANNARISRQQAKLDVSSKGTKAPIEGAIRRLQDIQKNILAEFRKGE